MKTSNKFSSVFGNWIVKVLSFLTAELIVLAIRFWSVNGRTVTIPLEVKLPESYTALSLVPSTVDIVITGSNKIIYLIDPVQIKATADFSDVDSEGISRVRVELSYNDDIYTKNSLTLSAKPESVRILFQKQEH